MSSPFTPSEAGGARFARAFALLVTNLIKLSGLAVALNELLLRPNLRTSAVALAAFMMAGAQLSEQAILAALDKLMGGSEGGSVESPKRERKP